MKHKILIFFIIFAIPAAAQNSAEARAMLEKSEQSFKKSGAITAQFTIDIRESGRAHTQSFDGTITIKGDKFNIESPDHSIWFDGVTQWVYSSETGEVNISEPGEEEIQAINPTIIYRIYKKNCTINYDGEKTIDGTRKVSKITLIPKNKKQDIKKITLHIDHGSLLPVYLHIHFKNNGLENEIYINSYKTNQEIPDTKFIFDTSQYPNAEIIDLR
ncbi:MAG: outer-membrane lipoprotein carrier protein LolA [Dysgonamonadaceae bacterium]|jgi:outer membrane lipoprotein-sorting protein|nr:outer-membrane lipoprotein carrier protein LolA [Dysgonamonadaceae bacterium]